MGDRNILREFGLKDVQYESLTKEIRAIQLRFSRNKRLSGSSSFDAVAMRKALDRKLTTNEYRTLCYLGVQLGGNVTKILAFAKSTTLKEQQRFKDLEILTKRLKLQDTSLDSSTAVTLSRVMACYPEFTLCVISLAKPAIFQKVPYTELQKIHTEFPHEARTIVGTSVIPKNLKTEDLHKALALFLASSLLISEFRNDWESFEEREYRKAKAEINFDDLLMKYFRFKVLNEEKRKAAALELKIVTDNGELRLSAVWEAAGTAALAWLKENYDFDLTEEQVSG